MYSLYSSQCLMKTVIQTAAKTHLYGMNILASHLFSIILFISAPQLNSFVHFLLIFKLFDVLVYIFGQSKLTMTLATDEKMGFISIFPNKILLICGVFL